MTAKRLIFASAAAALIAAAAFAWVEWRISTLTTKLTSLTGATLTTTSVAELGLDPRIDGTSPSRWQLALALGAIDDALAAYPPDTFRQVPPGLAIAGELTISGTRVGGTVQPPLWIILATDYIVPGQHDGFVQRAFHHEYSSLLVASYPFPREQWSALLPADVSFPTDDRDRLAAATTYAIDLQPYYKAGFVSDYGASSLENDINTYAELLLHAPEDLARLARDHALIRQKALLIRRYYEDIDPAFVSKFTAAGLGSVD
ncbi:hypothetical protein [Yoonia sp. 2307UL14-13]|uniref:hypothetical protein n=1 Tax=Yoonia sp. 2307UL14-13 TaxID=3126506 RepID=UPI00309538BD